ncbi:MAG: hypothetical protein VKN33_01095 [Candidatus Sericytochromatia bacterium]|nr:hypothetical protein [Candidatus Sericytochromatia bacterium]
MTPTASPTLAPATGTVFVDAATAGFNPRNNIRLRSGGVITFTNSNLATHIIQIISETVTSSATIASDTIATSLVATEAVLATGASIQFTLTASPALIGTATKKIFFKSMDKDFNLYIGDIDLSAATLN